MSLFSTYGYGSCMARSSTFNIFKSFKPHKNPVLYTLFYLSKFVAFFKKHVMLILCSKSLSSIFGQRNQTLNTITKESDITMQHVQCMHLCYVPSHHCSHVSQKRICSVTWMSDLVFVYVSLSLSLYICIYVLFCITGLNCKTWSRTLQETGPYFGG